MKLNLCFVIVLLLLVNGCRDGADQGVNSCFENAIRSESYQLNFVRLEKNLLNKGYLENSEGSAYRNLARQVMDRDDMSYLLTDAFDPDPIRKASVCLSYPLIESQKPLGEKLIATFDTLEKATEITVAYMAEIFLNNFKEEDWEKPMTKHLFFAFMSYHLTTDEGVISTMSPPWAEEGEDYRKLKTRNLLLVLVDSDDQLLVRGTRMPISELRETAKRFITNPQKDTSLAEGPTRAIISLKNERGASYKIYLKVYNELKGAYYELWNEYSQMTYGVPYSDDMPQEQKKAILQAIPFWLSEAEPTAFGDE